MVFREAYIFHHAPRHDGYMHKECSSSNFKTVMHGSRPSLRLLLSASVYQTSKTYRYMFDGDPRTPGRCRPIY